MERRQRAFAIAAPSALAVVAGTIFGLVAAAGLSPLFPVSVARRAEVSPGFDVDVRRARVRWVGDRRGDARVRGVGGGASDDPRGTGRLGSLDPGVASGTCRAPCRPGGDRRRHHGRRVRGRPTRSPCPVGRPRRVGRCGRGRWCGRVPGQRLRQPRRGVPVWLDVGHLARPARPRPRSRGRPHGGRPRSRRGRRRVVRSSRRRRSHPLHVRVQRLEGRDGRPDGRRTAAGRAGRGRPRTGDHASARRVDRRHDPLRHGRRPHGRRRDRHPAARQRRPGARGDHDGGRTGAPARRRRLAETSC